MLKRIVRNKIFLGSSLLITTAIGVNWIGMPSLKKKPEPLEKLPELPTREEHVKNLKKEEFDILIIGGGSVGTGACLDAVTRGLKVGLVERDDFSSGTSSKSTKLVHGGVRYLERAFLNLDMEEFSLVREALAERATFLEIAPHLTNEIPTILPLKTIFEVPYYYVGSKLYDLFAGSKGLTSSYFISKRKILEEMPLIQPNLLGGMVYYDGQHNDSRMNVSLAITSAVLGASIVNHTEVTEISKNEEGKVNGVKVKDKISGEEYSIKSKVVINATGPFSDSIRKMDDETVENVISPSTGVHLIFSNLLLSSKYGFLEPKTSDGRVLFFLPWESSVIVGTTDTPIKDVPELVSPTQAEIDYLIKETSKYLGNSKIEFSQKDAKSIWTGIRPLVKDLSKKNTQSLSRNHEIEINQNSGLISVAGGKWTTYRKIAEDVIDSAIKNFNLSPTGKCRTQYEKLIGSEDWNETYFVEIGRKYNLSRKVSQHLSHNYGTKALKVLETNSNIKKLHNDHPYLESEIIYSIRNEYALTCIDVLARRMRLAFLDTKATYQVLPKVIDIMSEELNWTEEKKKQEFDYAMEYLKTMGSEYIDIYDEGGEK
eukprot:gene4646-8219_t